MGMFDTILIRCVECGSVIECQSKSGECCLQTLTLEEAVETQDESLFDVNRHAPHECPECGTKILLNLRQQLLQKNMEAVNDMGRTV